MLHRFPFIIEESRFLRWAFVIVGSVGSLSYLVWALSGAGGQGRRVGAWALLILIALAVGVFMSIGWLTSYRINKVRRMARIGDERFREHLTRQFNVLRQLGVFAASQSVIESVQTIERRLQEEVGEAVGEYLVEPWLIARFDGERTIYYEFEDKEWVSEEDFEDLLKHLSAIGRGRFEPRNIKVVIEPDPGPFSIEYDLAGRHHVIRPDFHEEGLDPHLIERVNESLADSGYRFEQPGEPIGRLFLIMFNAEEKRRLIDELGWRFLGSRPTRAR